MEDKKYLSIPQVARILKISRTAVYKKVKNRQIPAIRVGKNYAIPEDFLKKKMIDIKGHHLTDNEKIEIEKAVKKTVIEYGEVLKLLGKE